MFSICIPNYNYEKYLGLTLDSIVNQTHQDFEIAIADNCSTDDSVGIIKRYHQLYPGKIKFTVNPVNVGFSGNLDRAAVQGNGQYLIMLSSDDTMSANALDVYNRVIELVGKEKKIILCSANDIIDPFGTVIKRPRAENFRFNVWQKNEIDQKLTAEIGVDIYRVRPKQLLKQALLHCTNPFNFCATCYSKTLYDSVGGYGGGRMINPDKWFHWKIMAEAEEVLFIDAPLFQYRWHPANQTAQQAQSGFLKYMVDEYCNVIEMPGSILAAAGVSKDQFINSFVMHDIFRHGIGEFSKGKWLKSFRIFLFGWSIYPGRMLVNKYTVPYFLLLMTTPLGAFVLSKFKRK